MLPNPPTSDTGATVDGKACEFESIIFITQVFFLQAIFELDSIFTGKIE